MGFAFLLAALKGLKKKKKKVRSKAEGFEGARRRRRAMDSKPSGFDMIPDELLMDILARLPAKLVVRSMCVSQLWYSLIASPFFTKLFLENPSSAKPLRQLVSLVDLEDQREYNFLSSSSSTHDDHSDTPVYVLDQVVDLPGMGGFLVNALRGLICVRLGRSVRICNLTTNQRVTLPIIRSRILAESNDNLYICFVHDPVYDEYKVLIIVWELSKEEDRVVRSEHQVLVLGPGASWRNTHSPYTYPPHCPHTHTRELTITGVLYYAAWIDNNNTSVVMSFDSASEDFNLIELPIEAGIIWHTNRAILMNYEGKLAVLDCSRLAPDDASVNLWVMENAEKKRKWSNKTLVLPILQMNFGISDEMNIAGNGLNIVGTGCRGELRLSMTKMVVSNEPRFYVIYDLEKNKITRRIEISPLPHLWFFGLNKGWQTVFFEDDTESIMYLET